MTDEDAAFAVLVDLQVVVAVAEQVADLLHVDLEVRDPHCKLEALRCNLDKAEDVLKQDTQRGKTGSHEHERGQLWERRVTGPPHPGDAILSDPSHGAMGGDGWAGTREG